MAHLTGLGPQSDPRCLSLHVPASVSAAFLRALWCDAQISKTMSRLGNREEASFNCNSGTGAIVGQIPNQGDRAPFQMCNFTRVLYCATCLFLWFNILPNGRW
ncbi:hypothetical protein FKM82_023425 [Ascaphus truei]